MLQCKKRHEQGTFINECVHCWVYETNAYAWPLNSKNSKLAEHTNYSKNISQTKFFEQSED